MAAAWLASRPEVDAKRLGITGTSLGSFISALSAEMEPRLGRCCVLLDGGNFVDGFAGHMRSALPGASFIGFTGTPIEKADANTRAVFGNYISVYRMRDAQADGATVRSR